MRSSKCQVLVLGGTGMLGHQVFRTLRERRQGVRSMVRRRIPAGGLFDGNDTYEGIDLERLDELERWLWHVRPAVIVNCAGVIKQRDEAHDPVTCLMLNALLPHRLARAAAGWGGRLIHFSTDCVFRGDRGQYRETDLPDALDLYGRTKALGEVTEPNALVLRTSMIGRELRGGWSLLEWALRQNGGAVKGYRRARFSGLTTIELARLVSRLMESGEPRAGLYHVAGPAISKFDLLGEIRESFGLRLEITPDEVFHCDRTLVGERFASDCVFSSPSWAEMLRELAADRTLYTAWERTEMAQVG